MSIKNSPGESNLSNTKGVFIGYSQCMVMSCQRTATRDWIPQSTVVSTYKRRAELIHQTTGTGKGWKPVQALMLDKKNLFHIAVCFSRICAPKGLLLLRGMVERLGRIEFCTRQCPL